MKKKLKTIGHALCLTAGIAAVGLFYACSEEVQNLLTGNGTEVQVNVSFADADETMTRAADGLNSTSGFSLLTSTNSSSKVRVMVDQNNGSYTQFDYNITAATTLGIATAPTFNSGVSSVNVYGWYPNVSLTDFSVAADQTGNGGYCLSDLMAALGTTCTRNIETGAITSPANLSFTHLMAKVKVSLTLASGVTVKSVKFKSMLPQVDVTPTKTSNAVTAYDVSAAEGDVTDITLLTGGSLTSASAAADKLLCGVFPEQSKNGAFLEIKASYNEGADQTITYSFSSAKTFVKGNVYVMNISLDGTNVTTGTVDITDWNTAAGTVNIGSGGGDAPTLSPSSLTLKYGQTGNITVSGPTGATAWGAISSNSSIATAAVSTSTVTVTPAGIGSCNINVYPTAGVTSGFSSASCAVTVNKGDATLTLNKTELSIGGLGSTETFTVTRQESSGTITATSSNTGVATTAVAYDGNVATVTVTGVAAGSATITVTKADGTLYGPYTASDKTVAVTVNEYPCSPASSKVGDIIASDGLAYQSVSAVTSAGKTAVAIVAYKGNGEANSSYNNGLALSMEDLTSAADTKWRSSGSGTDLATQYGSFDASCLADLNGISYTTTLAAKGSAYEAAKKCSDYNSTLATPTGCSDWFLPTIGQWNLILKGLTGSSTDLSTSTNNDYKGSNINTILEGFAGSSARMKSDSGPFWSSTEYSADLAWDMDFSGGLALNLTKTGYARVRAVLAF